MARPLKSEAIKRLQGALQEIPELQQQQHKPARLHDSPRLNKWRRDTCAAIKHLFGDQSSHVKEFSRIMYSGVVTPFDSSPDVIWQQAYIRGLEKADTLLRSMLDEIEQYWEADSPTTEPSDGRMSETQNTGEIFETRQLKHECAFRATARRIGRFLQALANRGVRVVRFGASR